MITEMKRNDYRDFLIVVIEPLIVVIVISHEIQTTQVI